ncbi:polyphosphoinositide phosphatase Fig4 [Aspergillus sclerotioniger CBS 115572]|uniref:Polyphosphoinositide phosphatase Fig4 n=1 Tax=Aspergillus sclerotioniger CBS 115572 TaxID=1450535 RepID=A0A317WPM9_9EURO|nr:polyphosphoinositide phosphatase Fig4 [Aspergillus sclerotioniger CBS 115572]PWY87067.1 polyphosphoinositide phosphatase Fig4 [Aspergillus sclerotioniger CBS 115572]
MESLDEVSLSREGADDRSLGALDNQSSRAVSLIDSSPPNSTTDLNFPYADASFTSGSSTKFPEELPESASRSFIDHDDDLRSPRAASPFGPLPYNPPTVPAMSEDGGDAGDEEPQVATSFERDSTPTSAQKQHSAFFDAGEEEGINRMHKFSLYETATRFYMVGMDLTDTRFKILKIDRTSESGDLSVSEDDIVYSKREMSQLLDTIDDGNKSSGGLNLKCSAWALLGFIRFTDAYYMLLVTKRSQVAMLGGHYVYQIDGTELISLTTSSSSRLRPEKNPEEARYIAILNNLDLTRSFYFSYSYDITHTLQRNICRERKANQDEHPKQFQQNYNTMFIWNHHLLGPAFETLKNPWEWCLPIIHGYVEQAKMSVYGRLVYITIIARRSRFFAGARFLKRGANDLGYVANDVETEQIVAEMTATSFHSPGPNLYANPLYTSYVQHRGSIPLYWTQENSGVSPKPDIELNLVDPFYSAAALHFDNLFERYGAPVYVLNLIKSRERTPRESKLLKEYTNAIQYLNQFLPEDKKIIYQPWDMSRAAKSRDQDVIGTLEHIAGEIIPKTGFFKNGYDAESGLQLQNGIARTNCIDCLDRTNAAQFVIGKRALGYQLHALGIIDGTTVEYDTDAVNLFTDMWHDHGDTIAIQYGGSHLVNTMATYRKINQWSSHSRDMVESFKRYYNNSFLDAQRQEAYNLFLGNYIFSQGQPMLWDLSTDYYLHHADPRAWSNKKRPNYICWYTPDNLKEKELPPPPRPPKEPLSHYDDYWLEYYRPLAVSSFSKIFSYRMNSTLRYLPFRPGSSAPYDISPFVPRIPHDQINRERHPPRSVKIQEPLKTSIDPSGRPQLGSTATSQSSYNWIHQPPSADKLPPSAGIMKATSFGLPQSFSSMQSSQESNTPSKAQIAQWTLGQLVTDSLNPSVTAAEAEEYERYINHPLKVPLVVTSEDELTATSIREHESSLDLLEYANKCNVEETTLETNAEENLADYSEFLEVSEGGLTVAAEDYEKKRYKRYRQWLRGKSLFKQRVDM